MLARAEKSTKTTDSFLLLKTELNFACAPYTKLINRYFSISATCGKIISNNEIIEYRTEARDTMGIVKCHGEIRGSTYNEAKMTAADIVKAV